MAITSVAGRNAISRSLILSCQLVSVISAWTGVAASEIIESSKATAASGPLRMPSLNGLHNIVCLSQFVFTPRRSALRALPEAVLKLGVKLYWFGHAKCVRCRWRRSRGERHRRAAKERPARERVRGTIRAGWARNTRRLQKQLEMRQCRKALAGRATREQRAARAGGSDLARDAEGPQAGNRQTENRSRREAEDLVQLSNAWPASGRISSLLPI